MDCEDVVQYFSLFVTAYKREFGELRKSEFGEVFARCAASYDGYNGVRRRGAGDGTSGFDVCLCKFGRAKGEDGGFVGQAGGVAGGIADDGAGSRGDSGERFGGDVGMVGSLEGVPKGKNWKRNQRRKMNRRGQINVDTGSELGSSDFVKGTEINVDTGSRDVGQNVVQSSKDALRLSLEEKWRAENELKVAKAKRELELLKAEDLNAVKKLRERKVQGATERTMVQIEKAHASLVQTGNVPGVQPVQQGFCHTVVDGEIVESVPGLSSGESKGCSISPSSSISEREVRQMKKELEDFKARCEKAEKEKVKLRERLVAVAGLSTQKETAFSLCDGTLPGTVKDALEEVHGMENIDRSYPGPHDPDTVYLKLEYPPMPGEYNDYY